MKMWYVVIPGDQFVACIASFKSKNEAVKFNDAVMDAQEKFDAITRVKLQTMESTD